MVRLELGETGKTLFQKTNYVGVQKTRPVATIRLSYITANFNYLRKKCPIPQLNTQFALLLKKLQQECITFEMFKALGLPNVRCDL